MPVYVCIVPVSPVRKEPSHKSEMVSQLLFGEDCTFKGSSDDWMQIECLHDGYTGWVTRNQYREMSTVPSMSIPEYTLEWISKIHIDGSAALIPLGSPTRYFDALGVSGNIATWKGTGNEFHEEAIRKLAFMFLNTSYLWGGRSVFGIDCSGYTQLLYGLLGIQLPRDASMQAVGGTLVSALEEMQCGDLAFFDNQEGRITHVGILLKPDEIIHAAGQVRIDPVDRQGIIRADTGKRTHRLKYIKRYSK